jgi:hypothetical protein
MPLTSTDRETLPKFLIAGDGTRERDFVLHCHYPSFILEFMEDQGVPSFIDSEQEFVAAERAAGRDPGAILAKLIRQAGEFFEDATKEEDE